MSAFALTGFAMLFSVSAGLAKDGDTELVLLRDVHYANGYAHEEMQCRGYSRHASVRAAERALGRDYRRRLIAAADKMKQIWGEDRVDEATTFLPIGHKITPEYCRKATGMVDRARSALIDLERKLGTK